MTLCKLHKHKHSPPLTPNLLSILGTLSTQAVKQLSIIILIFVFKSLYSNKCKWLKPIFCIFLLSFCFVVPPKGDMFAKQNKNTKKQNNTKKQKNIPNKQHTKPTNSKSGQAVNSPKFSSTHLTLKVGSVNVGGNIEAKVEYINSKLLGQKQGAYDTSTS